MTSEFVRHAPNSPEIRGPEAEQWLVEMCRAAFPDLTFSVEHLVAEGGMVAASLTARATHRGELFGVPATGKQGAVAVLELYRLNDGKIAE